jgi:hypothetical protein
MLRVLPPPFRFPLLISLAGDTDDLPIPEDDLSNDRGGAEGRCSRLPGFAVVRICRSGCDRFKLFRSVPCLITGLRWVSSRDLLKSEEERSMLFRGIEVERLVFNSLL